MLAVDRRGSRFSASRRQLHEFLTSLVDAKWPARFREAARQTSGGFEWQPQLGYQRCGESCCGGRLTGALNE